MPKSAPITSPYAREFFFPGGKQGILLIHGFTGSPGHMLLLGEAFRDEGYTVLGLQLPGHGTTLEDMERTGWNQWLGAVRDGYHRLLESCDDVFAAGLSMGGVLTLLLAEEAPLRGAVPIAAPMRIYDRMARYTPFFKFFVRYRGGPPSPDAPTPHEYSVGYDYTPVRKVPDLLQLMKTAEANLSKITCPLMVVQPRLDRTVIPESAQIIYDGAANTRQREILWLDNSTHVCTLEPEFDRLRDNMLRFFKSCMQDT